MPPPPELLEELLEEVFLRLPPDEPEHLVHASSVCKPWRSILADAGFRRRYRKLHGRPPVLGFLWRPPVLGFFQDIGGDCRFVPASAFRPAEADLRSWVPMDCRHGRLLFRANSPDGSEFVVWDPITGDERRVPFPDIHLIRFAAAVLCAVEGCDHHGCQVQGGPFRVAVVSTTRMGLISACLYSSETGAWSELTSVGNLDTCGEKRNMMTSIIVDDAFYFNSIGNRIVKYQLATLDLSLFKKPVNEGGLRCNGGELRCNGGELITMEDGGLGFAHMNYTTLTLWSRETSPDAAVEWAKHRVIRLAMLLPHSALIPSNPYIIRVHGFMDGTQVIFLGANFSVYMVELKSVRARMVFEQLRGIRDIFPYASFIPGTEVASSGQGQ